MDELSHDVRLLKNAVFGNPENPESQPGLIRSTEKMAIEIHRVGTVLGDIHADLKKGVWIVLTAVITATVALALKLS